MYVLVLTNVQKDLAAYRPGDLLKIEGVTGPGQFAPIVIAKSVQKLGTAAIPAAKPATYQELITGALDAQWVEVKGVVRQYVKPETKSDFGRITIATGGGTVQARFITSAAGPMQVDAEVTVHAVCLYQFNQKRQVLNPILQVPRETLVADVPKKIAPLNPYAAPTRLSGQSAYLFHRKISMRIRIVSTFAGLSLIPNPVRSSGYTLENRVCGFRLRQREDLLPGDKIDVLGFPPSVPTRPCLKTRFFKKPARHNHLCFPLIADQFLPLPSTTKDDLVTLDGTLTPNSIRNGWRGFYA